MNMSREQERPNTENRSHSIRAAGYWAALLFVAAESALAGNIGTEVDLMTAPLAPSSSRRIIVSIPDRKLALLEDGQIRKVYDVAVGARVSPSPVGKFKIINRIVKPNYYGSGKVVLPGKDNPLGTRWLGLDKPSYGIHGTNVPRSIGKAASHGCIRMHNRDAEELFEFVRPGDAVEIVAVRNTETALLFAAPQSETAESSDRPSPVIVAAMAGSL